MVIEILAIASALVGATVYITNRIHRWRDLKRRAQERQEYISSLYDLGVEYSPESCDALLIDRCKSLVKKEFPDGIENELMSLSLEARVQVVSDFATKLSQVMEISIEELVFFTPQTEDELRLRGCFYRGEKKVYINLAYLNADEPELLCGVIRTVLHEFKHVRQYEACCGKDYGYTPQLIALWIYNMTPPNYISCEESDEAYCKQPVELDTFGFSSSIINW